MVQVDREGDVSLLHNVEEVAHDSLLDDDGVYRDGLQYHGVDEIAAFGLGE